MQETEKTGFFDVLRADMRAINIQNTGFLSMFYNFFMAPDFLAVLLYRISSTARRKGGIFGKAISVIFWRLNILLNSCQIDADAQIGPGFSLAHPMGVVIGPVIMGRGVEVFQNVSLGRRDRTDEYSGPESRAHVGDGTTIYSGAVVVGGVKIGKHASIGANAVVLKDVPDYATAVGIPARIIQKPKVSLV